MTTSTTHSRAAIDTALATLQPIRDLSKNWDVDIASCLEEYLQELTGLTSTQLLEVGPLPSDDQNEAVPNFAHAALILQNSSNVYSRKVEYLHSLVYKALYEFFNATSGNTRDPKRKSNDASLDEFYDFDPNEDFLLLDDVVPEDLTNQKINLKEEDEDINMINSRGTPASQSLNRTRLSLGGISVTRLDRSSIGTVSSAQQRALLGTLNNGSLRLVGGRCDVGDDGVLLMPGSKVFDPIQQQHPEATGQGKTLFADEVEEREDFQPAGFDDNDDHSNDGPGFQFPNDDNSLPPHEGDIETVGKSTFANARSSENTKRVTFSESIRPKADPWAMLDPHASEGFVEKPLRKGKTYRLPEGIELPPSECVTGSSTRRTNLKKTPESFSFASTTVQSESLIMQRMKAFLGESDEAPELSFKGLVYGNEFAYAAKEAAKRRAAERRAERLREYQEQERYSEGPFMDENDDDEDGGGFYFGGDEENDYDDDADGVGNAGVSSLEEAFGPVNDVNDDDELISGKTFEELCRAHIKAFAKGAEEFALKTRLSERVGKWQARLAPVLEEEERRAAFDIHAYSKQLIDSSLEGIQRNKRRSDGSKQVSSSTVEFENVAKGCTQSDVCRLFLASLSLANSGNLEIEEGSANYRFNLISSSVERPMETYRAPSVMQEVS